jgi:adenosylcobinamide-GDP ribazoletransferase
LPKRPSIIEISVARLADVFAALGFLTRIPTPRLGDGDAAPNLARAAWAFPLVGLLVGAIVGLAYWAAAALGLASTVAAVWALIVSALLTGALHEDGLADAADGFGGGATGERKLEIMRDSRIGSYGALALVLSTFARVAALSSIADPKAAMIALTVAGSLGRASLLALLAALRPAREDGLARAMANVSFWSTGAGLFLAIFATCLLLPVGSAAWVIGAACLATVLVAVVSFRQIGGHTGDVLGAAEVLVECVVLTAIAGLVS